MATVEAAVNFNGFFSSITQAFNVTSVVNAGAYFQINFTSPITNPNYIALCNGCNGTTASWFSQGPVAANPSVTSFNVWSGTPSTFAGLTYTYCIIYTD